MQIVTSLFTHCILHLFLQRWGVPGLVFEAGRKSSIQSDDRGAKELTARKVSSIDPFLRPQG